MTPKRKGREGGRKKRRRKEREEGIGKRRERRSRKRKEKKRRNVCLGENFTKSKDEKNWEYRQLASSIRDILLKLSQRSALVA